VQAETYSHRSASLLDAPFFSFFRVFTDNVFMSIFYALQFCEYFSPTPSTLCACDHIQCFNFIFTVIIWLSVWYFDTVKLSLLFRVYVFVCISASVFGLDHEHDIIFLITQKVSCFFFSSLFFLQMACKYEPYQFESVLICHTGQLHALSILPCAGFRFDRG
jgi:hypothetical protein